jgi:DNA-binding PadR family transcriptional regulator
MSAYLGELEQLVLLAVIQLGEDAYGVTIRQLLRERSGRDVALATVYTTLERLEAKGCLLTRLGASTPERGGRRKRFFRPSARGQQALQASLAALRGLTAGLGKEFQP